MISGRQLCRSLLCAPNSITLPRAAKEEESEIDWHAVHSISVACEEGIAPSDLMRWSHPSTDWDRKGGGCGIIIIIIISVINQVGAKKKTLPLPACMPSWVGSSRVTLQKSLSVPCVHPFVPPSRRVKMPSRSGLREEEGGKKKLIALKRFTGGGGRVSGQELSRNGVCHMGIL